MVTPAEKRMSAFSTVLKIMLSDTVLVTPATLQQLRFMRATQLRSASQEVASAALTRSLVVALAILSVPCGMHNDGSSSADINARRSDRL